MDGPGQIGKLLIVAGAAIAALGVLLVFGGRLPWFGRLPGDIVLERKNYMFYFPVATSIILSLLLSLVLWLIGRK